MTTLFRKRQSQKYIQIGKWKLTALVIFLILSSMLNLHLLILAVHNHYQTDTKNSQILSLTNQLTDNCWNSAARPIKYSVFNQDTKELKCFYDNTKTYGKAASTLTVRSR